MQQIKNGHTNKSQIACIKIRTSHYPS